MKILSQSRVAIVGLGLMGGSLGGALKGKCTEVIGVARRAESVEEALARGFVDRGTLELAEGVVDADIVVLSTPVRVILKQLTEIGPHLKSGCLVMDTGSTKSEIVKAMTMLPDSVEPLGAHPMCGKEVAGIMAAEVGLYNNCTFVLTPLKRTSKQALELGRELAQAVGGRTIVLEAERHDRLVAAISHLPYVVSCALVGAAAAAAASDQTVWQVAASGFRDTSRLAASEVTMMLDILLTNREVVLEAIFNYEEILGELTRLLGEGDEAGLRTVLDGVWEERAAFSKMMEARAGDRE